MKLIFPTLSSSGPRLPSEHWRQDWKRKFKKSWKWLRLKYMILLTREQVVCFVDGRAWHGCGRVVVLIFVRCMRCSPGNCDMCEVASDQYKVSPPSNCIFIIIWPPPATASSPAVSNHKTRLQPEKSMIKKCLDFSSGTRRHLEESILNMWPTGVCDLCLKTS